MTARRNWPVDSQRKRLYDAENGSDWSDKARQNLTHAEATALAAQASKWLQGKRFEIWDNPTIIMTRGKGSQAFRNAGKIHFGSGRPTRWILLHEIAHLVSFSWHPGWDGEPDRRSHGAQFADVYLMLVGRFCSVTDRENLKTAFKEGNVRFRPKRKREMTDEQRAVLRDRLAASRPAPSPHRWTYARTLLTNGGPVTLYAATGEFKVYRYTDVDGRYCYAYGTTDPAKAVTRAHEESAVKIGKWRNYIGHEDDSPWALVDIATELGLHLTPRASTV